MPLFAILSDLFFNADSGGGKFVRHKFRALILPLIVWSFIVGIGFRGIRETYMHLLRVIPFISRVGRKVG